MTEFIDELLHTVCEHMEEDQLWHVALTFRDGWSARLTYTERNDERKHPKKVKKVKK